MLPKTLGESIRGRHSHSTLPLGATRAHDSQSERKPYSAMGGNGERPSSGSDEYSGATHQLSHTSNKKEDAARAVEGDRHALLCQADAFGDIPHAMGRRRQPRW